MNFCRISSKNSKSLFSNTAINRSQRQRLAVFCEILSVPPDIMIANGSYNNRDLFSTFSLLRQFK